MLIQSEAFGITNSGESITRYMLTNDTGMQVNVLDYGCTVQSIIVPDQSGRPVDVVLGYDDLRGYELGSCYIGAFVGRCANRIKGGSFSLNGQTYHLEKNDGKNHLHGIYSHVRFDAVVESDALVLRRVSPAGEEGYPGKLSVEVRYALRDGNALWIEYRAWTDADTVANFTNHSYFNLNGSGDMLGHKLTLLASRITERDNQALATGRVLEVAGTPLDFREEKTIGADIFSDAEQIAQCHGYDHNYIIDNSDGSLRRFATAIADKSGIVLEAFTTQPAVQFYTGSYLDEDSAPTGKNGARYPRYAGFCLETQHYPCSPNFSHFPSVILHPGEEYRQETVYQFRLEK